MPQTRQASDISLTSSFYLIAGFAYWECSRSGGTGKAEWSVDGPMFGQCFQIEDSQDIVDISNEMYLNIINSHVYDEDISLSMMKVYT